MEKIKEMYDLHSTTHSDINEHLPTLYELAKKCDHVTEMGTRGVVSAWALALANPKKVVCYDIEKHPNVDNLIALSKEYNVNLEFIEADVLKTEIEETDLLFIDTFHTYNQLAMELKLHSHKAKKYIAFHDTTSFGFRDENEYECISELVKDKEKPKTGLVPAIDEFMKSEIGSCWEVEKIYMNNNGFTILKNKNFVDTDGDNRLKLDFLKRILTDSVNNEEIYLFFTDNKGQYPPKDVMRNVVNSKASDDIIGGLVHPARGFTMIGLKRLNNVHDSLDYIRLNNIDGDIIETGVWRGGCCIFIKAYLDLYGMKNKVFVADSFDGLPVPDTEKYPVDEGDMHYTYNHLKVSLEQVQENFKKCNALDENVIFLKGWFSDTLPDNDTIGKLAILRFDGDMYGSTMDVLNALYSKVVDKGIIIIDDYCLPNCVKAVTDFRNQNNIADELKVVDTCGVWWYKN